ncbi:MAG: phage major capsid protein [Acidobacteria bacterium]|nr:phage major capsid protein [Acidobacteriota bacterium]
MDPETETRSTEELIEAAATRIAAEVAASPATPEAISEQIASQLRPQVVTSLQEMLAPIESDREALVARLETVEGELASRPETHELRSAELAAGHNPHAPGAVLDGVFATPEEFYAQAVRAGRPDLEYSRDNRLIGIGAVLSGQEIADGGALVPEEFRAMMGDTMLESAVIRPGAMVLPMSTETMRYPYVRDYDHSSGQVYGGWQVYRVERGERIPRTRPTWGQQRLTVTTQAAATVVANELLADSSLALGTFIQRGLPAAIGWAEDYDFIRGTGAGEPKGILESGALITTADAGRRGGAGELFTAADAGDMLARLLPACQRRAVFVAHPGMYASIAQMTLSGAQFARRGPEDDVPLYVNGRPVYFSEHCSVPGTSGDVILVDRSQFVIGDRQAVSVSSSMHLLFDQLETIIIAHSRNDGQLMMEQPLTLRHGGANWTVSCAVQLPNHSASVDVGAADPRLLGDGDGDPFAGMTATALDKIKKADLIAMITGADSGTGDASGSEAGTSDD